MSLNKRMIYVTGLPRSGSTLMCQLLKHHPDIYSPGHSSPLAHILNNIRYNSSDNEFLLSQLDVNFDTVYEQLLSAYRGFINGWFGVTDHPVVVDKNRDWLRMVETVKLLDPDFRMVVCVRDIKQIIGSIEKQHAKTRLLDFPDHIDAHSAYNRAEKLLAVDGLVGGALKSIELMQDIEDMEIRNRIVYVAYESLVDKPDAVINDIFQWLDLPQGKVDVNQLSVWPHESDSYYRFKYRHNTYGSLKPRHVHTIPPRIAEMIDQKCEWFYRELYPNNKVES